LHAWRLQFNHPAAGERMALQADLPHDLASVLPPATREELSRIP
jgi:23S rRNA pseudouridine955/2504/2580 synthase